MIFQGRPAEVADGLAAARDRCGRICGWAALSTAVSVVMGALESQGGIGGGRLRTPPGAVPGTV